MPFRRDRRGWPCARLRAARAPRARPSSARPRLREPACLRIFAAVDENSMSERALAANYEPRVRGVADAFMSLPNDTRGEQRRCGDEEDLDRNRRLAVGDR